MFTFRACRSAAKQLVYSCVYIIASLDTRLRSRRVKPINGLRPCACVRTWAKGPQICYETAVYSVTRIDVVVEVYSITLWGCIA